MKKITFLIALMLLVVTGSFAQASLYSFAQSSGTYVPITGGTVVTTATDNTPSLDSYVSAQLTLPTAFTFAGTSYTSFFVSSNGQIGLGATTFSSTNYRVLSTSLGGNVFIAPFSADLNQGATGVANIRFQQVADEIVIQWTNFRRFNKVETFNFQARLNTTTGVIKFVYDGTPPFAATVDYQPQVGIKSAVGNAAGITVGTTGAWTSPTFVTTGVDANTIATFNGPIGFTSGLTYTFTPPAQCTGTPAVVALTGPTTRNICAGISPGAIVANPTGAVTGLAYQWEQSTDGGTTWVNAAGGTGATTTTYTPPVAGATTIRYRFKATCTASSAFSISEVVTVNPPAAPTVQATALSAQFASLTSASLSWTIGDGTRRMVVVSTSPITNPTDGTGAALTATAAFANNGQQIVYDGTGTTVTLTGLVCGTNYFIKVFEYTRCGTAAPYSYYYNVTTGTNAVTFTAGPRLTDLPAENNFTGFTGTNLSTVFPGWYESTITTVAGTTPGMANPAGTTSAWTNSTVFTQTTAKINLYLATRNEWIISPKMAITANSRLKFKAAITGAGTINSDPERMIGTDDKVRVLISTDGCGAVWTPIYTFDANNTTALTNVLTDFEVPLNYVGQTIQIAFQATDGPLDEAPDYDFHIGNIVVEQIPSCDNPVALSLGSVGSTTATINWNAPTTGTPTGYEYYYSTTNTAPTTTTSGTVTARTANLTTLLPATTYYVWVRSACAGTDRSVWAGPLSFTTTQVAGTLPFTDNFESATTNWQFANGAQVNKWFIGTAVNNGGTKSMYVSSNATGADNAYTITSTTAVQAYRDIAIPAGVSEVNIAFDWKGGGETSANGLFFYDYLTVWAVPVSFTPTAGTALTVENSGGVRLSGIINLSDTFTRASFNTSTAAFAGQTVRLVFEWRNDGSGGTQPAIAVDNISITAVTCPSPSALTNVVTPGRVTLGWTAPLTAPASGYDYYYSIVNTAPTASTTPSGTVATGNTAALTTLNADTLYYFWVRSNCGGTDRSIWISGGMFRTDCAAIPAPTVVENFDTFTGEMPNPACWREGTGILGTTPLGLTLANSLWINENYNNSASELNGTAARIQLNGVRNEWIISPGINLGTGSTNYQLEYTASVMQFTGTAAIAMGEKFVKVVISTDGGATWAPANVLTTYDNANIPTGGVNEIVSLAGYTGVVKIAFYGYSTTTTQNLRFYIDNFKVIAVPSCVRPSGLTAGVTGENTAVISWTAPDTAPANGYEYVYSTTNTPPVATTTPSGSVAAGTLTRTIPGLLPSTTYFIWVRSKCGTNSVSEWEGPVSATTLCDAPELLTTVPGTVCGQGSATLSATVSGGTVNWYAAQTGGSSLGEGLTFATPQITATTTYWAEASIAGALGSAAKPAPATASTAFNTTDWGIVFDVTENVMLQDVSLYSTSAGTVNIKIVTAAGVEIYETGTVSVDAGGTATPTIIPLNYAIAAGTGYRMLIKAFTGVNLIRDSGGLTFPYSGADGVVSVTAAYNGGNTTGAYYWFYDLKYISKCAAPRRAVVATVTPAIPVTAAVSQASICSGASTNLSVTSANAGYTYVWMPGNLTGSTVSVSPTLTTTYTVTGTDPVSRCVAVSTVTVTVNSLPTPISVTPSPAVACVDNVLPLVVTGGRLNPETTIGTARTLTGLLEQPSAFVNRWTSNTTQTIYTAAEMRAAGLSPGNITGIAYEVASLGSAATNADYTVKIGTTTLTSFANTTFLPVANYTTVYGPQTYTHTASGWNTITFTTPYVWDGTSNLVISVTQNGANSTNNAETYYTETTDNTVVWANSLTATTGTRSTKRLNIKFMSPPVATTMVWSPRTNLYTDAAGTIPYTGGDASTVYFKSSTVAAAVNYTITSTTTTTGCSTTGTVAVSVANTLAPTAAAAQTFCNAGTVADLVATGQAGAAFRWYTAATGGTALAPTTALVSGTVYYGSQIPVGSCEGLGRVAVTATVNVIATPTAPATQTICNAGTLADLTATGVADATIKWYSAATGGTAIANTTDVVNGGVYYASQTVGTCESIGRAMVTVTINFVAAPVADATRTFCNTGTVADLTATGVAGATIKWYTEATGGTALAATTPLTTGTYYASQTVQTCESAQRAAVAVTVNVVNAPTAPAAQTFCESGLVSDLQATGVTGATINWYAEATGGTALTATQVLAAGTYYASQTLNDCTSPTRTAVVVSITTLVAPTADAAQVFCNAGTVAGLTATGATGSTIKWYTEETGGTALTAGTQLVDGAFYYASQTVGACESAARVRVAAQVNVIPEPQAEATQQINIFPGNDATTDDIVVTGVIGDITWYASEADALAGENPLPAGTVLVSGTTYYGIQTILGCSSLTATAVTVTTVLDGKEFDLKSFSYYPNPVKDVLNFSYTSDISSVAVFNLLGQQVIATQVNAPDGKIDMSNLADGTYIINVVAGSSVKTIKVIKRQ